jgi:hypothetical protein
MLAGHIGTTHLYLTWPPTNCYSARMAGTNKPATSPGKDVP